MLATLIMSAGLLVLCVLSGLPAALALRSEGTGWWAVLADSAVLGTPVLVLVLALTGEYNLMAGLAVLAVAVVVPLVGALARGSWPARRRPGPAVLAAGVVVAAALVLRSRPSLMPLMVSDMGDYITAALAGADGRDVDAGFPQGFTEYLEVSVRLLGPDNTVAGIPATGVILVVAVIRLSQLLRAPSWLSITAGAVAAVHPAAVYFSTFPVSEGLQAALLVALVHAVLLTLRAPDRRTTVVAVLVTALAIAAAGLNRITGPVLILPLALVLVAAVVAGLRDAAVKMTATVAACGLSAGLVLYHHLATTQAYALRQLSDVLPPSLVDDLVGRGVLSTGPLYPALLLAAVGVVALTGLVWWRWLPADVPPRRAVAVTVAIVTSLMAGALIVLVGVDEPEAQAGLMRFGLAFLLLACLSPLVPVVRDQVTALVTVLLAGVTILFVTVHALRLDEIRVHTYWLYWDRYLYSEYFPSVLLLATTGLAAAWVLVQRVPAPTWFRRVVPAALVAALAIGVVVKIGDYRHFWGGRQQEGAFALLTDLGGALEGAGPVVWSGQPEALEGGFVFPNTWYAFGRSLARVEGIDLRTTGTPFSPDPLADELSVGTALSCQAGRSGRVVELEGTGPDLDERLDPADFDVSVHERVSGDVRWLPQLGSPADWKSQDVAFTVYDVTLLADDLCVADLPVGGAGVLPSA